MLDFLGFVLFSFPVCLLSTSLLFLNLSCSLFCSALKFGASDNLLYSMVRALAPLRDHFFLFGFEYGILCNPGWPWTWFVEEGKLELPILLPPPLGFWVQVCATEYWAPGTSLGLQLAGSGILLTQYFVHLYSKRWHGEFPVCLRSENKHE